MEIPNLFGFDFTQITWKEILDFVLVSFVYYRLILLVKGTRAVPVMYGLVLVVLLYYFSSELGLTTLNWLLQNFLGSIFLIIIILFQADIRKGLAAVGTGGLFRRDRGVHEKTLEEIVRALTAMAQMRVGALIVIEKTVPLGDVGERGIPIRGEVTKELLMTIFHPNTPLHDGAVIIQGDKIMAAGCVLPLTTDPKLASQYGTRHRAAIGISEETDAVVTVVSEERGSISVVIDGKLVTNLDEIRLRRVIRNAWAR
ncbi:diadenylate cyclase CdaA [Desulfocurvibacter africanus]|uniref:Diadenylate cyclase n=1 Tax=Desulfocurvibacter africanus subsp. africanus str. Walvis Bay TaxID=690850 RepID=F3Z3V8_DESAF|nr:diadenylate cyclase CdaA [Desulfocurvibacter africanus]EGJ51573.1 Conserved hypothetical protein CHP00159 [Desulfocurvibacter africanus subsp. africanus str. Walvis Bay]